MKLRRLGNVPDPRIASTISKKPFFVAIVIGWIDRTRGCSLLDRQTVQYRMRVFVFMTADRHLEKACCERRNSSVCDSYTVGNTQPVYDKPIEKHVVNDAIHRCVTDTP